MVGDCKWKDHGGARRTLASDRSDDSLRSPPPPPPALALARRRRCLDAGFAFSASSLALTVTRLSFTCRFDANSLSTSAFMFIRWTGSKSDMRKEEGRKGNNCLETMVKPCRSGPNTDARHESSERRFVTYGPLVALVNNGIQTEQDTKSHLYPCTRTRKHLMRAQQDDGAA